MHLPILSVLIMVLILIILASNFFSFSIEFSIVQPQEYCVNQTKGSTGYSNSQPWQTVSITPRANVQPLLSPPNLLTCSKSSRVEWRLGLDENIACHKICAVSEAKNDGDTYSNTRPTTQVVCHPGRSHCHLQKGACAHGEE